MGSEYSSFWVLKFRLSSAIFDAFVYRKRESGLKDYIEYRSRRSIVGSVVA